jgi:recombination protein RecT
MSQNTNINAATHGNTGAIVRTPKEKALAHTKILESQKAKFAQLLPKHVTADEMIRSVASAIARTPDLIQCDSASIVLAVAQACAVGLVPNTPLSQGYLVPFRDKHSGKTLCQFIPSYRGLVSLATNSGEVKAITSHVVYERDTIEVIEGTEPKVIHVRYLGENPGKPIGVYAVALLANGERVFEWMSLAQVQEIRDRSKAASSGPWVTDFSEMARKTVVRRLYKSLPATRDKRTANAMEAQAQAEAGETAALTDVVDVIGEVVDEDTGEVIQEQPKGKLSAVKERIAQTAASVTEAEVVP